MSTNTASRRAARPELGKPAAKQRGSSQDRVFAGTAHAVLFLWTLVIVAPLLWTFLSAFKSTREILSTPFALPKKLDFTNFVHAWDTSGIGQAFLNTIIVVGVSLICVMLLGSMCAYVLARFTFPGRKLIYVLMLSGLTFPIILAVVPLSFIFTNMKLNGTLLGLIISYVAFALPFTVFFLYAFFKALPFDVSEAAAIDGAGPWRTFFSIMAPMAAPGIASIAIFNFLGLWNQYILPVTLNQGNPQTRVLAQVLASYSGQAAYNVDYGALFAAVVITIVPVLIVYIFFQRTLQGSVSQGTDR